MTAVALTVGAVLANGTAPAYAEHRHRHQQWEHDGGYSRGDFGRRHHDDSIRGKDLAIGLGAVIGAGLLFSMLSSGSTTSAAPPVATPYDDGTSGYGVAGSGPVDAVPVSDVYLDANGVACREFREVASGRQGTACQNQDGSWTIVR